MLASSAGLKRCAWGAAHATAASTHEVEGRLPVCCSPQHRLARAWGEGRSCKRAACSMLGVSGGLRDSVAAAAASEMGAAGGLLRGLLVLPGPCRLDGRWEATVLPPCAAVDSASEAPGGLGGGPSGLRTPGGLGVGLAWLKRSSECRRGRSEQACSQAASPPWRMRRRPTHQDTLAVSLWAKIEDAQPHVGRQPAGQWCWL